MMRMNAMRVAAVASLALLLASAPAGAALMEGDLAAPADGLITTDTATGLQWLDLTATLGISYNAAEASGFVTNDGFRHATIGEVATLFGNADFPLPMPAANNPANDAAANLLLGLLGCTQFCGTVNATGRGFADGTTALTVRPNYHNSGLGSGAATLSLQSNNLDLVDATSGHFLVRVPEASTGLMMLLGLGLAMRRRSER
jgi:hypothetical protein